MFKTMKAERYRIIHSKSFTALVVLAAFTILMGWAQYFDYYQQEMGGFKDFIYYSFYSSGQMMITMFLPIIATVLVGGAYQQKVAYYEVMGGRSIHSMLMGRIIVDGGMTILAYTIFNALVFVVVGAMKGYESLSGLWDFIGVNYIIVIHVVVSSVLMGIIAKGYVGIGLVYARFTVLEVLLQLAVDPSNMMGDKPSPKLLVFVTNQLTGFENSPNATTLGIILATCFIEIVFWYIIAYVCNKKKYY